MPAVDAALLSPRRTAKPRNNNNKTTGDPLSSAVSTASQLLVNAAEDKDAPGHGQRAPGHVTPMDHPQGSYADFCESLCTSGGRPDAHSACALVGVSAAHLHVIKR